MAKVEKKGPQIRRFKSRCILCGEIHNYRHYLSVDKIIMYDYCKYLDASARND